MASTEIQRPSFFELFKEQCGDSDLGTISLNWFEELTAEAAPYEPTRCDSDPCPEESAIGSVVTTPVRKPCALSQLDSTPIIFKGQVLSSPLFLSPTKDVCKSRSVTDNTNLAVSLRSPNIQTRHVPSKDFSPSNRCLQESPIVIKELFKTPLRDKKIFSRTPQKDGKPDIYDSLFGTPKLMRNQTPCISESLGAELDPEMSWSSSLATPPSPTVIIAKANEHVSRQNVFDSKNAVIVQSLFSKLNKGEEKNVLAPLDQEEIGKRFESKKTSCPLTNKNGGGEAAPNVGKVLWKQTVANAVKDQEVCQTVENALEGMEDVLSIFFTNEKNTNLRKVNTARVRRKVCTKTQLDRQKNESLIRSREENPSAFVPTENNFESDKCKEFSKSEHYLCDRTGDRNASSVYEWSQLNLCELDTTLLENPSAQTDCTNTNTFENYPEVCSQTQEMKEVGISRILQRTIDNGNASKVCGYETEYITVTSEKKVPVNKTPFLSSPDQGSVLQQERESGGIPTERQNSATGSQVSSSNLWHVSQSKLERNTIGASQGEVPENKTLLSAFKRQTKFVYCINPVPGNPGASNKKDISLDSISDRLCTPEPSDRQNKKEFNLPVHDQQRNGVKEENREDLSCNSLRFQEIVSHSEMETNSRYPSDIKRKALATADLLSRKPVLLETLDGQQEENHAVQQCSVQRNDLLHRQTEQNKINLTLTCNVAEDPVAELKTEAFTCLSPLSGKLACNQQVEDLPKASEAHSFQESKSVWRQNSRSKCVPFHNHSENPTSKTKDSSANAINVQSHIDQLCASKQKEVRRDVSMSNNQHSENTISTHSSSVSDDQSLMQPTTTVNKLIRTDIFSGNTESLKMDFQGFKTASNKKIQISEKSLKKGEILFKEIEGLCPVIDVAHGSDKAKDSLEMTTGLDVPASIVNLNGFRTASNKEINVSENTFAKGRLVFKEIEEMSSEMPGRTKDFTENVFDVFPKPASNNHNASTITCSVETGISDRAGNIPSEGIKLHQNKGYAAETNLNEFRINKQSSLIGVLENENRIKSEKADCGQSVQMSKTSSFCDPQNFPPGARNKNSKDISANVFSPAKDVLTESQTAEVNELSSILENADSQYEFTQCRKVNPLPIIPDHGQSLPESTSESQNFNSEIWNDVDFNDSFAGGGGNLEDVEAHSNCEIIQNDKSTCESKNILKPSLADLNVTSDERTCKGFSLASGKSVNITNEALLKSVGFFGDLEDGGLCNVAVKDGCKGSAGDDDQSTSKDVSNVNRDCMIPDLTSHGSEPSRICDDASLLATLVTEEPANRCKPKMEEQVKLPSFLSELDKNMGATAKTTEWDNSALLNGRQANDEELSHPDISVVVNRGFQTASGKKITFSQSSLERVRSIFAEDDVDTFRIQHNENNLTSAPKSADAGSCSDDRRMELERREGGRSVSNENDKGFVVGFCTAGGKKVTVSKDSLAKVSKLFEEQDHLYEGMNTSKLAQNRPCTVVNSGPCTKDTGRFTEGANAAEVPGLAEIPATSFVDIHCKSEYVLSSKQNTDDFLKHDPLSSSENSKLSSPSPTFHGGFTTGKGKIININKAALLKAKNVFNDIADLEVDAGDPSHLLNVSYGKDIKDSVCSFTNNQSVETKMRDNGLCHKANDQQNSQRKSESVSAQTSYMSPLSTFTTASGKMVTFSHDSLQKAKRMFLETNDSGFVPDTECKPPKVTSCDHIGVSKSPSQGDALLSRVSANRSKVDKSNQDPGISTDYPCVEETAELHVHSNNGQPKEVKDECFYQQGVSIPKMPCFSTANGRSIELSEEALRKAKGIFSEASKEQSLHQREGHSPSCNKGIEASTRECSQKSIQGDLGTAKEASKGTHRGNINTVQNSFGFSTASGKIVSVSDAALRKVKDMLQEFDDIGNLMDADTLLGKPFPSEGSTSAMNKPEEIVLLDNNLNWQNNKPNLSLCDNANTRPLSKVHESPYPTSIPGQHSTPSDGNTNEAHVTGIPKRSRPDRCFAASHTPENDFELEAAESAKAFMDDEDLMAPELRSDDVFPNSNKTAIVRVGKRLRTDDGGTRGEPPIKRQLLPEFDRATAKQPNPNLKPLTSSPDGTVKDRRKPLYSTLKPLTCNPSSYLKGAQHKVSPKFTEPRQFCSKSNIFQHAPVVKSMNSSSDGTSQTSNSTTDSMPAFTRSSKTFVPPFKKPCPQRPHSDGLSNTRTDCATQERNVKPDPPVSEEPSCDADLLNLVSTLRCARDMQEMRLRKKQRQKIKPQPGSMYLLKTSSAARIPLLSAVYNKRPTKYSKEQLYMFGVVYTNLGIDSENAASFRFHCPVYFTKGRLLCENGVQIADGGWLIPADNLQAGKEEIYRALCDTPGVDPKLISPEWVYNHYRWIVWKLAALEVKFPEYFASRCLTPERVLLQLKYRYDVEIDKSQRSAIRKIMEKDDSPAKTLVLCVSRIISMGTSLPNQSGSKTEAGDSKRVSAMIEVTDGWYGIKALLDPALTALLQKGRLFTGQKIITHGAELVGSDEACTPLEAPDSIMLKLAANSTRPAVWHTRLGYFRDPRPFCLRLSSLFSEGGIAGCVDVVIQRIYPIQYMEKMPSGLYVFRNERAEERQAERHSANQQKNLEALFAKIQTEFERQEVSKSKGKGRRQSLSRQQMCALQDGAEIYEAIQSEADPGYLENCLSNEQRRALNHHRQALNDKKQAQIQAEFRKAIESSEERGCAGRDVTAVLKIRVADYKEQDCDTAYTLNIWRPLADVLSLLKEGSRFRMYNMATSLSKSKCEASDVQLTATKKTRFQQLPCSQGSLAKVFTPREATAFGTFLEPCFKAPYGEVDVVGLVIFTCKKTGAAPIVYLSDESHNLLAVKFWTALDQLALEELTKPCTLIAAANLRWRSECISRVPTVYAGDLSVISSNPKELHLQKAIQKLKHSIQHIGDLCDEAVRKLMALQQLESLPEKKPPADRILEPHTPGGKQGAAPRLTPAPIATITEGSICTPKVKTSDSGHADELDLKTCKKMKGLDFLSRIPSPPPLTPVRPFVSPSLQKAFRPPRSCSAEKRKTEINAPRTPRSSKSITSAEGGFVADEELAMINTQAFVLPLEKRNTQRETNSVNLNDSPKPKLEEEVADALLNHSPTPDDLGKINDSSALPQKKLLQRKRKRK
ncbi:breast cancer type 2 susceptibility protein [Spea bombifrons]|uniref:breast cancer type 2 susceptibility protein n=1 Tax=Spea bombifrons TaxID=233779 RepID=UPI00234A7DDE|nr:breast cancer type 2 susceptibility protein [Spea bombifrons]